MTSHISHIMQMVAKGAHDMAHEHLYTLIKAPDTPLSSLAQAAELLETSAHKLVQHKKTKTRISKSKFMLNQAKKAHERILAENPDNIPSLLGAARIASAVGAYGFAFECVRRAIDVDFKTPEAWETLAALRTHTGEHLLARKCLYTAQLVRDGQYENINLSLADPADGITINQQSLSAL